MDELGRKRLINRIAELLQQAEVEKHAGPVHRSRLDDRAWGMAEAGELLGFGRDELLMLEATEVMIENVNAASAKS